MRAPYLEISDDVLDVMDELGYRVVGVSVDTKDYVYDDPDSSWRSFDRFLDGLDAGGSVVLAHDSYRSTAEILVEDMLEEIEMRGLSGEFVLAFAFAFAFVFERLSADGVQLSRLASVLVMTSGIGLSSCGGSLITSGIGIQGLQVALRV